MIVPEVGAEVAEQAVGDGMVVAVSGVSAGADYILFSASVTVAENPCASGRCPTLLASSGRYFYAPMRSIVVTLSMSDLSCLVGMEQPTVIVRANPSVQSCIHSAFIQTVVTAEL